MQSAIWDFLSNEGFQPHGMCLLWRADVFWAHILSDILIAVSYFSIPIALVVFAMKRRDFNYRWVLLLFGGFIVACGFTHAFGIWTMWVPDYGMQAIVKMITAMVSVATAIALWPLMPKLLALPSTSDLAEKNAALAREAETREQTKQELRELNNELEERVAKRTSELEKTNADLIEARLAAEKSNAAKSEFLAAMSHEVRTPMNGVLGMLGLLKPEMLNDDQKEVIGRAKEAADGLLEVINDILDYSKLEAGSVELSHQPFSPNAVVHSVASLFEDRARAKGLELRFEIDGCESDSVIGDARRFRQIMMNLVGNAVKFTQSGSVVIRKTCGLDAAGDATVMVRVADTGIGIDDQIKDNLFERFYQGDPGIARRFGGTGLGLAISKELVELMRGEIWLESTVGQGSTFTFLAQFENCTEEVAAAHSARATDSAASDHALAILLAEDNETNRYHLSRLLTEAGHTVFTAKNGAEAVAMAEERQYDIILMDIYMPEMDGTVAARVIRTLNGPSARTPIVALTANAMVGDRQHYLSKGMDEYVSKPVDPNALFSAIWKVVQPRRMVTATG
ncbi:MAG: ATP-binding protein [Pseudomonadota bacterium]